MPERPRGPPDSGSYAGDPVNPMWVMPVIGRVTTGPADHRL